jgi:hypothetical protein
MAKIGKIKNVPLLEIAPCFNCTKNRAISLAVAASVADD